MSKTITPEMREKIARAVAEMEADLRRLESETPETAKFTSGRIESPFELSARVTAVIRHKLGFLNYARQFLAYPVAQDPNEVI